jgi:hypothetical protein
MAMSFLNGKVQTVVLAFIVPIEKVWVKKFPNEANPDWKTGIRVSEKRWVGGFPVVEGCLHRKYAYENPLPAQTLHLKLPVGVSRVVWLGLSVFACVCLSVS